MDMYYEHAEYHLIDKELATRDLSNATLFVTLEPCTVRKNPKKPCAERIVRARINKVFIGIYDPHPDVQGRGAFLLSQNDIKLNYFDEDLLEVIKKENKDFIEYCLELENQDDKKNEESILFKNKYDLNIKPVLIDSERPYRILRIYPKFDSGHLFSISETQIEEELLIKYKKLFNWDKKYSIDKIIYSLFYFQGEEDSPTRNHSEICENGYVYYHEDCNEGGINLERTQQIYKEFLYFVKDFYNYINFKGDLILNCDFQNVLNQHLKSPKLQFELKNYKSS